MRLVCDKCQAVYTIDDSLVGTRDFRVSCKTCGKPIFVKSARQVTYAATHRVRLPGAALPPPSLLASAVARTESGTPQLPKVGGEAWFISVDGRQRGPLSAAQIAVLFEAEGLDWGTEVWREGLKGWRPARRDALLVTSMAGARGVANDTTRLDAAKSFLAPEDTVVEARPQRAQPRGDATEKHILEVRPSASKANALPDLRPSARPQAWHSPENTAFREALGLPTDSSQRPSDPSVIARGRASPEERSAAAAPAALQAGPTMADAFVSVPKLLHEVSVELPGPFKMAAFERLPQWVIESVNSHYLVGLASFGAGVLLTVIVLGQPFGRPLGNAERPATATVQAQAHAGEAPGSAATEARNPAVVAASVLPVATVHSSVPTPLTVSAVRELPTVEDLRAEVRKVAPDVRRCVEDPSTGVDVDIYLDGPTGRVRDVDVRSPLIPPGRAACIMQAIRHMQLSPFSRDELKLMHKFSW